MKLHSQSLPSNTRLLASGETSYITSVEQSLITSKRLNTFFYSAISKATTERPLKPAESSSTGPIPLNISFAIMNHPFFNSRYTNLKEVNPLSKQWNMRNLSPIYLFCFLVAHFQWAEVSKEEARVFFYCWKFNLRAWPKSHPKLLCFFYKKNTAYSEVLGIDDGAVCVSEILFYKNMARLSARGIFYCVKMYYLKCWKSLFP